VREPGVPVVRVCGQRGRCGAGGPW